MTGGCPPIPSSWEPAQQLLPRFERFHPGVSSMRHRTQPLRVAEWAELLDETVGDAVDDAEEPSTENCV